MNRATTRSHLAVAALAAIAVAALTACSGESTPPPQTVTTTSSAESLSPSPSESESKSPFSIPESVMPYMGVETDDATGETTGMDAATFFELPRQEQDILCSYIMLNPSHFEGSTPPEQVEGWASGVTDPENNPLTRTALDGTIGASLGDRPRDIIEQINFARQVPLNMYKQNPNSLSVFFDPDMAQKMEACVYQNTSSDAVSSDGGKGPSYLRGWLNLFTTMGEYEWHPSDRANSDAGLTALGSTELLDGKDLLGNPIKYRDITVTGNVDGTASVERVTLHTFTGYDGKQHSQWRIVDEFPTDLSNLGSVDQ